MSKLIILFYYQLFSGMASNFDTYPQTYLEDFYTHYDYYSIMHYPMFAFSRNSLPTVVPRLIGVTIGNRNDLSLIDLVRIRHYYSCGRNASAGSNHTATEDVTHTSDNRRQHMSEALAHSRNYSLITCPVSKLVRWPPWMEWILRTLQHIDWLPLPINLVTRLIWAILQSYRLTSG